MARAGILAAVAIAWIAGGCGLVTGGTDGYSQAPDGGRDGGQLFGGDAGSACGATSDCAPGQICCLGVQYVFGTPTPTTSCQTDCSGGVPLCTTNADCPIAADGGSGDSGPAADAAADAGPAGPQDAGDAGRSSACIRQQCSLGGLPATVGLCGQVFTPYCAAAP